MFKLKAKFDADWLLYLLSHFECDGHTVHMLIQQCLLPSLTSTMKLSLFIHVHSSPLSLAARLHQCCAVCSLILTNGWTFSQADLIRICTSASEMLCITVVDFYYYHAYDDFPNFVSIHLYNVDLEKLQYEHEKESHSSFNLPTHQTFINACFVPGIMLNVENTELNNA